MTEWAGRDAFAAAMELDGVEANIKALGTLQAADMLGVDREDVIAGHRQPSHQDAAAAAERYRQYVRTIPSASHIPQPTPPPRQGRVAGNYGKGRNVFLAPGKATLKTGAKRRGRSW